MPKFDSFAEDLRETLSPELAAVLTAAPLQSLGDGPADAGLTSSLQSRSVLDEINGLAGSRSDELRSALWLAAGDLDRSHGISQGIENADGSFLHGIMHRREGDFSNAKYWFRRAGSHAIEHTIASETGQLYADAMEFVNQCQQAVSHGGNDSDEIESLQRVQWV